MNDNYYLTLREAISTWIAQLCAELVYRFTYYWPVRMKCYRCGKTLKWWSVGRENEYSGNCPDDEECVYPDDVQF